MVVICLAICCLVALVVTFSLYPGWMFFDSATQWGWARQIATKGIPHSLKDYDITSHWPIFNSFMRAPFYWLTGETGFFIFIQAVLYNVALYMLGAALLGRRSLWLLPLTLVLVLSPISMNYSVFHSSDTIVAICVLVAVAVSIDGTLGVARRATLLVVTILLMTWVRYNALFVSIFMVGVFFWLTRRRWGTRRAIVGACVALVLLGGTVAALRAYEYDAYMRDGAASGVAIRLLDASRHTDDPMVHALIDPIVAANPTLQAPLDQQCYASGWCQQLADAHWPRLSTSKYMRAYLHLLLHHPWVFVVMEHRFGEYILGIWVPLQPTQIRTDIPPPFPSARETFNHTRLMYLHALRANLAAFSNLAARAGVVLLLGLLAAVLLRRRGLLLALLAVSIGYLGPLLLLAGTNNFRYTFPVTIVATVIVGAGVCVLLRTVVRGASRRLRRA